MRLASRHVLCAAENDARLPQRHALVLGRNAATRADTVRAFEAARWEVWEAADDEELLALLIAATSGMFPLPSIVVAHSPVALRHQVEARAALERAGLSMPPLVLLYEGDTRGGSAPHEDSTRSPAAARTHAPDARALRAEGRVVRLRRA